MISKAEQWDRQYGKSVQHHVVIEGKFVPKDRPCDWCGEPVELGYIHEECAIKERKKLIDIVY